MSHLSSQLGGAAAWIDRFGTLQGLRLIAALRRLSSDHAAPVPLGGYRSQFWLRPHTTDVHVFTQVFRAEQYAIATKRQPKLIFDCGAHIGCATVYFAHRYPDAQIVAIEANHANYELLTKNTSSYPNVRCVHGAIWPRHEFVRILNPQADTWAFQVAAGGDVQGFTINELLSEHGSARLDILKLDIEGAERDVCSAADARLWMDHTDVIMAELHDHLVPGCSRALYKLLEPYEWGQAVDHEIVTITVRRLAPEVITDSLD
jgi:FkbM family methyltransferase